MIMRDADVKATLDETSISSISKDYPWYQTTNNPDLAQGDILFQFPIFEIPPNYLEYIDDPSCLLIKVNYANVIVMTQSCDLVIRKDGKCKVDYVLLCPFFFKNELVNDSKFKEEHEWEQARQGRHIGYHVLNRCKFEDYNDFILVDLKRNYSINVDVIRNFISREKNRIRLLPPYREHLSQAFATYFMRVGLPVDIPKFSSK